MTVTIIEGNFDTLLDIPASKILAGAQAASLTECMVYGYTQDGEPYFAATTSDLTKIAFILNRAMHKVMMMADDNET